MQPDSSLPQSIDPLGSDTPQPVVGNPIVSSPMQPFTASPGASTSGMTSAVTPSPAASSPQSYGETPADVSEKNYVKLLILSSSFGFIGVDRFYLGKKWTGILKLITFGGLGVWWLVDWLMAISGAAKDKQGNPVREDVEKYRPFFVKIILITIVAYIAFYVGLFVIFMVVGFIGASNGIVDKSSYFGGNTSTVQGWNVQYGAEFASDFSLIGNDFTQIQQDTQSNDVASLATDCQTLGSDVQGAQAIPAYPNKSVASDISAGLSDIANAANSCASGATSGNASAIRSAASEIQAGVKELSQASSAISGSSQ